ncbi:LysM peptidoglycan-binding domain-containing protein [Pseudolysinimonas sp.]|uniref:LysM peptidoglycan-binding domain-containing protein n=1 Tax=Pseudolysinimonas sp. TaxID=2680009 RepID=UPI003F815AC8
MSAISISGSYHTRPTQPRLRITPRGRAVLTLVVAVPLALAAIVGGIGAVKADGSDAARTGHYSYTTVTAGESLWQVAQEIAPKADPRDVVADISSLNGLDSGVIQPGQRLAIPPQYAR